MVRYETLMLAYPEHGSEALESIKSYFEKFFAQHQGKMISFDVWGKYRLSYPVKKQTYGIYALVRFELPENEVSMATLELRQFFQIRCSETIMRYVTKKLSFDAPLEYQKPEAIIPGESSDRLSRTEDSVAETAEEVKPHVTPSSVAMNESAA